MSIADLVSKIKSREHELFHSALLLIVALGAFGLGYFAGLDRGREPIKATFPESQAAAVAASPVPVAVKEEIKPAINNQVQTKQVVVASKQGTKYHYPHCPGAKQIKEVNQVWFNSPAEAEQAGYTLAGNCQAK